MPTFTERLGATPTNSSGVYGQPTQDDSDALRLVNQLKDREMMDYKDKANFTADLALRQEQRMRSLYDPAKAEARQNPDVLPAQMSPTNMSEYQKGELGIRQQEADIEKARVAQQGKMGQEALSVKEAQEKLNQQKSDQINELKHQELQSKVDEHAKNLQLAKDKLADQTKTSEDRISALKKYHAAMEDFHKAESARKEHDFQTTRDQLQRRIDILEEQTRQRGTSETTTEVNPEGTKKTITTKKGSAVNTPTRNSDGSYSVTAPDGTKGTIPADKLDDWMRNHQPGGEQ